jgi:hypothetical protein
MSEIDFQNGLVAGLMIAGKNGAVGGVGGATPPAGDCLTPFTMTLSVETFPLPIQSTGIDYPE